MVDFNVLYNDHVDFRRYVDKCCNTYGKTVAEMLQNRTIQDVGLYYLSHTKPIQIEPGVCDCGGIVDDKSC